MIYYIKIHFVNETLLLDFETQEESDDTSDSLLLDPLVSLEDKETKRITHITTKNICYFETYQKEVIDSKS